jgi:hypothetical protein
MPPVGFETTVSADERPQTYALDRAATDTGKKRSYGNEIQIDDMIFLEPIDELSVHSELA